MTGLKPQRPRLAFPLCIPFGVSRWAIRSSVISFLSGSSALAQSGLSPLQSTRRSNFCIAIGVVTIAVGWISFIVEVRNRMQSHPIAGGPCISSTGLKIWCESRIVEPTEVRGDRGASGAKAAHAKWLRARYDWRLSGIKVTARSCSEFSSTTELAVFSIPFS